MRYSSWQEFLAYASPAVVALLYATARWVEGRARITSEVERSISREAAETSSQVPEQRDACDSDPDAPDPKKS
jgi:heme exporter protein D